MVVGERGETNSSEHKLLVLDVLFGERQEPLVHIFYVERFTTEILLVFERRKGTC